MVEGEEKQAQAISFARTFGLAMHQTNILRDVGAAAANGRCSLPDDALGAAAPRICLMRRSLPMTCTPAHQPGVCRYAIVCGARGPCHEALTGIDMLAPDSRRCSQVFAVGYASSLDATEEARYALADCKNNMVSGASRGCCAPYAVSVTGARLAG